MRSTAAGAALVLVLAACSGGAGDSRPTRAAGPVAHIVYRIEDRTQTPPRVTTQVVDVDSPYVARLVTRDGPPPGRGSMGGAAWERDRQYVIDASGTARVLADTVPSFAGPDAHLDVALPVAERLGLAERSGSSVVAGVDCAQWRSRDPLDSGAFAPPTQQDNTLTCVDGRGRVLADRWTLGGQVVRVRTAITVTTARALDGAHLLDGQTPKPLVTPVSTTLVQAEPANRLTTALGVAPLPAPRGFRLDRSVALIDVDTSTGTRDVVNEGAGFAWIHGDQLVTLVIRRGLRAPLPAPREGAAVLLGSNGTGRLTPVLPGLRIRLRTPGGLILTATANVSEQSLTTWLTSLDLTG